MSKKVDGVFTVIRHDLTMSQIIELIALLSKHLAEYTREALS